MNPKPEDQILDVGVASHILRGTNFLEQWYPCLENITALAKDDPKKFLNFNKHFPKIKLIVGDGRKLPFWDNQFILAP